MDIVEYLTTMNEIQKTLHEYIDSEDGIQEKFNRFTKLLKDHKIQDDKHKLAAVIKLISIIIDYHYRTASFFDKIFNIIIFLKDDIKKHYTNYEIAAFFSNKKVLLFLFREKIISFDKTIVTKLNNNYYFQRSNAVIYLYPEVKQYIDKREARRFTAPENLEELRETEYADNQILQLIQKDLIDEFISYVNTNKINLDESIENSLIFETNPFLEHSNIQTAIEYSAFFGSIKIFKYLFSQKCVLNPNLFLYAIHGRNPEIIHILEENILNSEDETSHKIYEKCLSFAIKCQHNELVDYLIENHIKNENISSFVYEKSLKYFNFQLIQPEKVTSDSFYEICIRNHYNLAKCLLCKDKNIDINSLISKEEKSIYTGDKTITKKTALFSSISLGYVDIVQLLLENKDIDVNKKSIDDCEYHKELTPLFNAVDHQEKEIVSLLLNHKDIDVNMKSIHGKEEEAPLNAAISNDDDEIVQLLLNHKDIDINLRSLKYDQDLDECTSEFYREVTPLYQAAGFCTNPKVIELLLNQKNIDINAIINIREEQYLTSTKKRFEPRQIEDSALFVAVDQRQLENVRLLLTQENIDVNFKYKLYRNNKLFLVSSILERAVLKGNIEILKLLLDDKRFDVNEKIMFGYTNDDVDVWNEEEINKTKIEHKKQYDGSGWSQTYFSKEETSILHLAIDLDMIDAVRVLLENENIDVNVRSFEKGYEHVLASSGGEKEEKKLDEKTPLYFAIEQGHYEIVKLLVEHKNIDINKKSIIYCWQNKISPGKKDEEEDIPCNNEYDEEEDLKEEEEKFEQGVKEVNKEETALHVAVAKGKIKIIKLLLSNKNIDINATDKQGRKPIELTHKEKIISLFNQLT